MVYLNRIYTKTGDSGETGLGDGSRVLKNCPRIEAIGAVDELNSELGLVLAHVPMFAEDRLIRQIQNDLFDIGADLCLPQVESTEPGKCLRVTPKQVASLEQAIDRINTMLAPLNSFILPGGCVAAAILHSARTVCRRAERCVVTLMASADVNVEVLKYVNRLSDLLFVLARHANDNGATDVLWVPGGSN